MYLFCISDVYVLLLLFFLFRYVHESIQCIACSHEKAAEASDAPEAGIHCRAKNSIESVAKIAPSQKDKIDYID